MRKKDTVALVGGYSASSKGYAVLIQEADTLRQAIFDRIKSHPLMEGRTDGGFICAADHKGQPRLVLHLGNVYENKLAQFCRNAQEKALRLSYGAMLGAHMLSRHSRDEARERWIGAVLGRTHILSFSGWQEDADEIFMLLLAVRMKEMSREKALTLARKNKFLNAVEDLF